MVCDLHLKNELDIDDKGEEEILLQIDIDL